ncbi:MAG: methionyl-tRNA formyltransferase [Acidobacteria bacterium]|nr:methionyl-tRNA formyltransferase [Acidobacteriota bacterium]
MVRPDAPPSSRMRVLFFGSPEAAIPTFRALVESRHEVLLVVTQPDKPAGRGLALKMPPVKTVAAERGLSVRQPGRVRDPEFLSVVAGMRPDALVVVAYGQILPQALLDLPPMGSLNVHFSLLPKYRGAAPVQWAVYNGEKQTGITIMRMDAGLDTGPILAQRPVEIRAGEDAATLESRLAHIGAGLLVETLNRLEAGPIPELAQDASSATYAPLLKKEHGRMDWTMPAQQIWRRQLAFARWPGVFFEAHGQRVRLLEGRPAAAPSADSACGAVLRVDKSGITVGCGEGEAYLVVGVQPTGKSRMDGRAFANGYRISPGVVLT